MDAMYTRKYQGSLKNIGLLTSGQYRFQASLRVFQQHDSAEEDSRC